MADLQPNHALPQETVDLIVDDILAWDGRFPLRWSGELARLLQDPRVFRTYLATHALIWGVHTELANTERPSPAAAERNSDARPIER